MVVNLKTFCVVHLSDLHISHSEDPGFQRTRESLMEDLCELRISKGLEIDAIAMTGDTVDKGGSEQAFLKAQQFYTKLMSCLQLAPQNLIIVPGNHDIPRRSIIPAVLENIKITDFQDLSISEEYWETFRTRFKNFNMFVDSVTDNKDNKENIFGGSIKNIETKNGIIQFSLINSSWSTTGERDFGNLIVGRWQLEQLRSIKDKLPYADLTISLMHHPLSWLESSEKEMVIDYLTDSKCLAADILLNGHIHSGRIDMLANPDWDLVSLVSGIGYPEYQKRDSGSPKLAKCRYAVYKFDLDKNQIEVWLRISRDDGTFVADTSLYRAGKENGYFTLPIKKKWDMPIIHNENHFSNVEVDPVPLITDWVGRESEIINLINSNFRAASITGVGGQGKSSLASEILRRYSRKENSKFKQGVWVDCRELPNSLHSKIIDVLEALSDGKESAIMYRQESLEETAKRFLRNLKDRPTLVVFDNIDAYINVETEGPTREFKPIVDIILNSEHNSFVLFTCRMPFNDDRASFTQLQLNGLSQTEGVEFFRKRGIELRADNDEKFCSKLVELTLGHPLYLGLIAGQVKSGHDTLKKCVEMFRTGEVIPRTRIMEYFKTIWIQLKKELQVLLRYLVEAPRPLTDAEIVKAVNDYGSSKIQQSMRRLERLGLLERHEDSTAKQIVYQVHPLLREFIYDTYPREAQKSYVIRVLKVFLPQSIVDVLFDNANKLSEMQSITMRPKNLFDSIETCLNSRNEDQALALIEQYWRILNDEGYHHQFLSLSCRILDEISWDYFKIVEKYNSALMVSKTIYQLGLLDDIYRSDTYLQRYASIVQPNTLAYTGYLNLLAHLSWREKNYEKTLRVVNEYYDLVEKLNGQKWDFFVMSTIRGLALRDSGAPEQALEIFQKKCEEYQTASSSDIGNLARTFMKLRQYDKVENLLVESLNKLSGVRDFTSCTNKGYAYLWLAETMLKQNKINEAMAFLLLCKEMWTEYAPVLLKETEEIENLLKENHLDFTISVEEAQVICDRILNSKLLV